MSNYFVQAAKKVARNRNMNSVPLDWQFAHSALFAEKFAQNLRSFCSIFN